MAKQFQTYSGNWIDLRNLRPMPFEIDYHADPRECDGLDYYQRMDATYKDVLDSLKRAQERGDAYVMYRHGWSTSHQGTITQRSQIRKVMRSKEATPYVVRKKCIQHQSVFVAAIRQNQS